MFQSGTGIKSTLETKNNKKLTIRKGNRMNLLKYFEFCNLLISLLHPALSPLNKHERGINEKVKKGKNNKYENVLFIRPANPRTIAIIEKSVAPEKKQGIKSSGNP